MAQTVAKTPELRQRVASLILWWGLDGNAGGQAGTEREWEVEMLTSVEKQKARETEREDISWLSQQPQAALLFWAPVAGGSTHTAPPAAHPHRPGCPLSLTPLPPLPSSLLHHTLCALPLLGSSPGLQAVQRLVHVLLVEAGHVRVHVPVVVADVALGAAVGHRAEPERRRELVGLLELWRPT